METNETAPYFKQPPPPPPPPPESDGHRRLKKAAGPLAVLGALLLKFKVLLLPLLKLLPFLKTGGTMLLSMWFYSIGFGWPFAVGFVILIFIHECGHLIVAKKVGLRVGAPMFIPFVGALITLKELPRNAWIEAQIGIGGPMLGAAGAAVCFVVYRITGSEFYCALAYVGFWLNLFNLAPISPLDGGRIVTALSPWLWLAGVVVMGVLLVFHFSYIILLIVIFSAPRLFSLFRRRTDEEARYFEVTPQQRWSMGAMYFGLMAFLVLGMMLTARPIPAE